jgi:phage terminase large subunit-like protein
VSELADFREFCRELTVVQGGPLVLEEFQETMLGDYFDGCRETLILVSKKQGKTTLLSALALFHLLTESDAACFVAAASREQASLLYDAACGFVARSPALRDQLIVRRGYRELWTSDKRGRLKVLASDVDTADGVLPSLCLVDELHRHRNGGLYGVLADGLGPRGGQIVTISTAGDDERSPLGQLRQRAHALPGMVRDGAYRCARAQDFAMHEWALDADQNLDDLDLVKTANPASWQTVDELRKRKESPSTVPWQWARFACGVWMFGHDSAISDREWRACAQPGLEIPPGTHGVFVGLDLAWRYDCTAATPVCRDGSSIIVHPPTVLSPPGDGTSIDAEDVWSMIVALAARWPALTIVADPNAGAPELLQRIERELPHVRLAEFAQAPFVMAMAAGRLQEAIATAALRHPDDETLTAHVLAATASPVGEGYRLRKASKSGAPIDAVIALAMAVSTLVAEENREPEPEPHAIAQWTGAETITRARASSVAYVACSGCGKSIHPDAGVGDGRCTRCAATGTGAVA